jgi:UrcA family protein
MGHHTAFKSQSVSMASILIVLAGAAIGGTAQAGAEPRYDSAVVSFGDLNLDSPQGTKALYSRLRNGAEDACSSFEGRDLFFKRLWRACFDQAVAAAVMQVNRPALTTLHKQAVNRIKT